MDSAALVAACHSEALRKLASFHDRHFQGLAAASRYKNVLPAALRKRLLRLDAAFQVNRHITAPYVRDLVDELSGALRLRSSGVAHATSTCSTASSGPRISDLLVVEEAAHFDLFDDSGADEVTETPSCGREPELYDIHDKEPLVDVGSQTEGAELETRAAGLLASLRAVQRDLVHGPDLLRDDDVPPVDAVVSSVDAQRERDETFSAEGKQAQALDEALRALGDRLAALDEEWTSDEEFVPRPWPTARASRQQWPAAGGRASRLAGPPRRPPSTSSSGSSSTSPATSPPPRVCGRGASLPGASARATRPPPRQPARRR